MLQFPEKNELLYEETTRNKIEHTRQERERDSSTVFSTADRRRFSMMVENILDPDLYVAALSDFLYTITSTVQFDYRPRQRNGTQGQLCTFEEGVLCQRNNAYPGIEIKLTSGSDHKTSGWYAAILAVVRRLIMGENFEGDSNTTMMKTSINVREINLKKANTILKSLRCYEETIVNYNIGRRRRAPAGRIVHEFINDTAALTKRLFVALSERRLNLAEQRYENSLETDRCFNRLGGGQKKTVLRFCKACNYSKSSLFYHFINFYMKMSNENLRYLVSYKHNICKNDDTVNTVYQRL